MSLHKTRYFHLNNTVNSFLAAVSSDPFNGFTAKISPTKKGEVYLSVAFCSKHDQFCRKAGRAAADKAPTFIIPVTNLPARLVEFENRVYGYKGGMNKKQQRNEANQWAWVWKYFL